MYTNASSRSLGAHASSTTPQIYQLPQNSTLHRQLRISSLNKQQIKGKSKLVSTWFRIAFAHIQFNITKFSGSVQDIEFLDKMKALNF